jgi:hypothetical protein
MEKDVFDYIARCMECQRVKVDHRHPTGFPQPLAIPDRKWEVISINFIAKLPMTTMQYDSIMEVVDKLTNAAHFVPVNMTHTSTNIA